MASSGQSSKASKVQDVDIREKLSLWESSLATLTSSQKDGIMSLSAQANNRPLPRNVRAIASRYRLELVFGLMHYRCRSILSV